MIGHGGLLRAFSFARPIRGSGHIHESGAIFNLLNTAPLFSDSPQSNNLKLKKSDSL